MINIYHFPTQFSLYAASAGFVGGSLGSAIIRYPTENFTFWNLPTANRLILIGSIYTIGNLVCNEMDTRLESLCGIERFMRINGNKNDSYSEILDKIDRYSGIGAVSFLAFAASSIAVGYLFGSRFTTHLFRYFKR